MRRHTTNAPLNAELKPDPAPLGDSGGEHREPRRPGKGFRRWLRHMARVQAAAAAATALLTGLFATAAHTDSGPLSQRARMMERMAAAGQAAAPGSIPGASAAGTADGRTVVIQAPSIDQMPQLYNGCEVTSLSMLLGFAGVHVNKSTLAAQLRRSAAPLVKNALGQVVRWGDPNSGFVGSMRNPGQGYGVYHGPIAALLDRYLPHRSLDLTGASFSTLLDVLRSGRPLVVWTTLDFQPTSNWITWQSPDGPVRATMMEHAVLLVGYGPGTVYVNDPLGGAAREPIPMQPFRESWIQLGRQAVTVTAAP